MEFCRGLSRPGSPLPPAPLWIMPLHNSSGRGTLQGDPSLARLRQTSRRSGSLASPRAPGSQLLALLRLGRLAGLFFRHFTDSALLLPARSTPRRPPLASSGQDS